MQHYQRSCDHVSEYIIRVASVELGAQHIGNSSWEKKQRKSERYFCFSYAYHDVGLASGFVRNSVAEAVRCKYINNSLTRTRTRTRARALSRMSRFIVATLPSLLGPLALALSGISPSQIRRRISGCASLFFFFDLESSGDDRSTEVSWR